MSDYGGDGEEYYYEEISISAGVPTKQHRP